MTDPYVVEAKIDHVMSNDQGQHDISFEGLTNREVISLVIGLEHMANIYHRANQDEGKVETIELRDEVLSQAPMLKAELDELTEEAASIEDTGPGRLQGFLQNNGIEIAYWLSGFAVALLLFGLGII